MGRNEIAKRDVSNPSGSQDWKNIAPGLLVSLISLAVVFYFVDLDQLIEALQFADYRLVAAGALFSLIWLVVRGMVWQALLKKQASLRQTFLTINEGYLLNNILPLRLGEVGRAFLLARKAGLEFWEVFSTVLIERVFDLAIAAGLLLSTLAFVVGADWAQEAAVGAGVLVAIILGALFLLARNRDRGLMFFARLVSRWPRLAQVGEKRLAAFFSGLAVLNDGRLFLRAAGLILLNWAIAAGQYYILLRAFLPEARFLWAAFSLAVGALGIAAPSSPGAVGVLELSIVGALAVFGQSKSTALAFAITAHLIQYLLTGLIGAYALARDGETLSGIYHQVRRVAESRKTAG